MMVGGVQTNPNPKCQDLSKFSFSVGEGRERGKERGRRGGRVVQTISNPKCQDLSKFSYLVGVGEGGQACSCIADSLSHTPYGD